MADQAADQQCKRRQNDKDADELAGSSCREENTRKRQKRNGPQSVEFYKALEKELNKINPVAVDKSDIEMELRSGSSILVLENTTNKRSHCRALLCLKCKLIGILNIESDYRFNLKDLTGERASELSYHLQPNRYYHVTCIEHILDLTALLKQNQIKMEGGISTYTMLGEAVCAKSSFHPMIEDWFVHGGRSFDVEEYSRWDKAYNDWEREYSTREIQHQLGDCRKDRCTCRPIPKKPPKRDYFSADRTPRLLSEALASVAKMRQIDRLPKAFLDRIQEEPL